MGMTREAEAIEQQMRVSFRFRVTASPSFFRLVGVATHCRLQEGLDFVVLESRVVLDYDLSFLFGLS